MNGTQSKMARAAFGLSAAELGRMAGVGRMTVIRFEAGENIADESRAKLVRALSDAGAQFSKKAGRVGVTVPDAQLASHLRVLRARS